VRALIETGEVGEEWSAEAVTRKIYTHVPERLIPPGESINRFECCCYYYYYYYCCYYY
jgi:hypothetical protein